MMSLGIVFHAAQMYTHMNVLDYYWDPARSLSMDIIMVFINTFRMPVFFALSGFFTALLYFRHGSAYMLKNRWQRVVLPFLILLPPLAMAMSTLRVVAYQLMEDGSWAFNPSLVSSKLMWDNTHNLWFLYYLMLMVITAGIALKIKPVLNVNKSCTNLSLLGTKVMLSGIVVLTLLGSLSPSGRISADVSFIPNWKVYSYFGICFLLGWIIYSNIKQLQDLAKYAIASLIIAVLFLFAALACFSQKTDDNSLWHWGLSLFSALSVYCFICGFFGLFSKLFKQYSPWVRYFSDSAYWIFIFHSIPMVIIALPLHFLPLIAELKFLIVCTLTMAACLWTYQKWVRYGGLGELLNGKRYKHSI